MLRFIDSFDHYPTVHLLGKWTRAIAQDTVFDGEPPAIVPGAGRRGGSALRYTIPANAGVGLPTAIAFNDSDVALDDTCVVGFGFRASGARCSWANDILGSSYRADFGFDTFKRGRSVCLHVLANGTSILALVVRANGTVDLVRVADATTLASSDRALRWGLYHFLELKCVMGDGDAEVRVNGDPWLTVDGADLGSGEWSEIAIGHWTCGSGPIGVSGVDDPAFDYDDLYVCDGVVEAENDLADFLGDVQIDVRQPTADGDFAEFTPSIPGAHAGLVSDQSDSTFVSSLTPAIDSYVVESLVLPSRDVVGVQVVYRARGAADGVSDMAATIVESATAYPGETRSNGAAYRWRRGCWSRRPSTLGPITSAAWSAMQIGVENLSGA